MRILGWPEGVIDDADYERGDSGEMARGHEFGREGVDAYMKTKSVWAQL